MKKSAMSLLHTSKKCTQHFFASFLYYGKINLAYIECKIKWFLSFPHITGKHM